jgi:hypothetical protein
MEGDKNLPDGPVQLDAIVEESRQLPRTHSLSDPKGDDLVPGEVRFLEPCHAFVAAPDDQPGQNESLGARDARLRGNPCARRTEQCE